MELFRWSSALDPSYILYFYKREEVLGQYSVARLIANDLDDVKVSTIFSEVVSDLAPSEAACSMPQCWLFEATGPEPDTKVNRYFKGAKNSTLLGHQRTEGIVHEGHRAEHGAIWWFALYRLTAKELEQHKYALFGLSKMLLLFCDDLGEKPDVVCNAIFDAVCDEKIGVQTRFSVPRVLQAVLSLPKVAIVSGFGSEDFGGFVLDVFSKLPTPE